MAVSSKTNGKVGAIVSVMAILAIATVQRHLCQRSEWKSDRPSTRCRGRKSRRKGASVRHGRDPRSSNNVATDTSTGARERDDRQLQPLGGLMPLFNMQVGEVIFGGVGTGAIRDDRVRRAHGIHRGPHGGRTPEFLGKKIEGRQIKLAMLAVLVLPVLGLLLPAISVVLPAATGQLGNSGAHGFSEMIYMFTSTTENNGSACSRAVSGNTYLDIATGIAMLLGRFLFIIPVLMLAGRLPERSGHQRLLEHFSTELTGLRHAPTERDHASSVS